MRSKKAYREVEVVLKLNTAASLEYLRDPEEWKRVFAWAQPGDADTDQVHFDVLEVEAKELGILPH